DKRRYGQVYFELVEKQADMESIKARIKCVIWGEKLEFINSKIKLQDGLEVLLLGYLRLYEKRAEVQFEVIDVDPNYTIGAIHKLRQLTIKKLKDLGVYDNQKHLKLKDLLLKIGLITSKNSAAYHDFISELYSSGYCFQIYLYDAFMEGAQCVEDVIRGLNKLYSYNLDVVCIIRGGGSKIDFIPFDDFKLAFKIATYDLPVLTGLGHEIDISVSDLVAYFNFKTPTKVAQFLVERVKNFDLSIDELKNRLFSSTIDIIDDINSKLDNLSKEFLKTSNSQVKYKSKLLEFFISKIVSSSVNASTKKVSKLNQYLKYILSFLKHKLVELKNYQTSIKYYCNRFKNSIMRFTKNFHNKLEIYESRLVGFDTSKYLNKGFSIVYKNGGIVKSVKALKIDDEIEIQMKDGSVDATIKNVRNRI
ncbi:MAG: exodeoxyribonuclease VII large subunit, partial [bacterium]|nr:exodeoxyribonuclease VII large subunit [bacterium]